MNKHSALALCLFVVLLHLTSCSSLNFVAGGNTTFKVSPEKNSNEVVEVENSSDFYLWGTSPGLMTVNLEDIETKLGMTKPSFVSVEQSVSFKNMFYTLVTFGLYCPVDYKIKMLKVQGKAQ